MNRARMQFSKRKTNKSSQQNSVVVVTKNTHQMMDSRRKKNANNAPVYIVHVNIMEAKTQMLMEWMNGWMDELISYENVQKCDWRCMATRIFNWFWWAMIFQLIMRDMNDLCTQYNMMNITLVFNITLQQYPFDATRKGNQFKKKRSFLTRFFWLFTLKRGNVIAVLVRAKNKSKWLRSEDEVSTKNEPTEAEG